MRYIVDNIDANRMELQTYDKKGRVVYVRQGSQSSINKPKEQTQAVSGSFSLKGEKLTDESRGGVIIKGSRKYLRQR